MLGKLFTFSAFITLSASAFAQDVYKATKSDMVTSGPTGATSGPGLMPIVQLLVAMVIVVGILKVALPKLIPNLKTKFNGSLSCTIKIEESATFSGGQLLVVNVQGRKLLLGSTPQNLTCLADLTKTKPEEPAFFELVDAADGQFPKVAVTEIPSKISKQEQLDRLQRLLG